MQGKSPSLSCVGTHAHTRTHTLSVSHSHVHTHSYTHTHTNYPRAYRRIWVSKRSQEKGDISLLWEGEEGWVWELFESPARQTRTGVSVCVHTLCWCCRVWLQWIRLLSEPCHMYAWVISHTWISHVKHMSESCHMYEWVMSHAVSYFTYLTNIVRTDIIV